MFGTLINTGELVPMANRVVSKEPPREVTFPSLNMGDMFMLPTGHCIYMKVRGVNSFDEPVALALTSGASYKIEPDKWLIRVTEVTITKLL